MKSCFINIDSSVSNFTMFSHHSHNFHELYVLADGKRTFYLENEEYTLHKNDVLLVPASMLHRTDGGSYKRYLVNFTDEYLDEEQRKIVELCQLHQFALSNEELELLLKIIEKMYALERENFENASNKSYPNRERNERNMRVCFSYLLFSLSTCKNFPTHKYEPKRAYNARTKKIMDYIQNHYAENITLDSLCELLYVSKAALCNDFKKNTDTSIIEFLLKTRLHNACLLLENTDKKMNEISAKCGFSSAKYFYLIFNKHMGVSPSEFKKSRQITSKKQPK